jgi:signal transduction histidine kinase/CheY-like chemotaxis protein
VNNDDQTIWWVSKKDLLAFALAFFSYFILARFSLYIYYEFETSPAAILPQIGLALAAMILGGYRMWLPILLAQILASYTTGMLSFDRILITAVSQTLQAVASLYILRTFGFTRELGKLKDMLLLIGVALLATSIAPTFSTVVRILTDTIEISPINNWARGWGAGIFSVLAFTPIIIKLALRRNNFVNASMGEKLEALGAYTVLVVVNYVVFWTVLPQFMGIIVIFLLPAVFLWFALRLHPRWLALGVFITAIQSVAGAILAHATDNPLNEQLLAIQIYVSMVSVIFYVLAAVVEERRKAYTQLAQSYEMTLKSDKAKNDFIAILAHELRNPLAPVISSLELLKARSAEAAYKETVENALTHTLMMRRLLDDLLDMARLVQNKITLRRETSPLLNILKQCLASVDDFAKSRNIEIKTELPREHLLVYADPIRLKQVVINLLNNACKYTHRGGTVILTYGMDGGRFFIQVADNGVGITSEMLHHIFEPFQQAEGATRYGSGLGIGLFLTKRLVEMHGGTIEVHSSGLGKGSTFTVYLPHPETLPEIIETTQAPVAEKTSRILIVDDNEAAANILQKLLNLHKQETEVAYSGKDALMKISTFDPHVILLDIGMPDMDGYETARQLRAKNWNGAIVALSGFGQDSDKERSKAAGFDTHLVKPVGIDEILQTVALVQTQKIAHE